VTNLDPAPKIDALRLKDKGRPLPHAVAARPREEDYGTHIAWHNHDMAQLLYAAEGMMRVTTEVGVWILPPRRALLIAPGIAHEVTMLSKVAMRSLYLQPDACAAFVAGCKVIEVSGLLRELVLALGLEPLTAPMSARGQQLTQLILSELAAAQTVPIAIPWPRDRRLIAVCSAIMRDPGMRRSVETLASEAGASARTLIRLFPRETGLHYRQWVQQVHLSEALRRLAGGDSVGDIARALGYASPSAFTAMFRRILGRTPHDYASEWRSDVQLRA
jgi:AraC-like DNA-binding protein